MLALLCRAAKRAIAATVAKSAAKVAFNCQICNPLDARVLAFFVIG